MCTVCTRYNRIARKTAHPRGTLSEPILLSKTRRHTPRKWGLCQISRQWRTSLQMHHLASALCPLSTKPAWTSVRRGALSCVLQCRASRNFELEIRFWANIHNLGERDRGRFLTISSTRRLPTCRLHTDTFVLVFMPFLVSFVNLVRFSYERADTVDTITQKSALRSPHNPPLTLGTDSSSS